MFYEFQQNNSGGSFVYDKKRGISVSVIVEADSADYANKIAKKIGLYFDGSGDCSCCGSRWYEPYDYDCYDVPTTGYTEVKPGDLYPAKDETTLSHKWMDEGKAEGFIHYLDGRIEPFHQYTAERKDLDGTYGWITNFSANGTRIVMAGKNGYDESGNISGPWHIHSDKHATMPEDKNSLFVFNRQYGAWVNGWYRHETDATAAVESYEALKTLYKAAVRILGQKGGSKQVKALEAANAVWQEAAMAADPVIVKIVKHIN